jgi:hypothetical protein
MTLIAWLGRFDLPELPRFRREFAAKPILGDRRQGFG